MEMTSAITHMPIANWAARSRNANREMGTEIAPASRVASSIATYGETPWAAKKTVPYAPIPMNAC